jgi:hypothetical protein
MRGVLKPHQPLAGRFDGFEISLRQGSRNMLVITPKQEEYGYLE